MLRHFDGKHDFISGDLTLKIISAPFVSADGQENKKKTNSLKLSKFSLPVSL